MATKTEKREAMFSLIENWKSSGQGQHDFCKSQGLAYSGFHYWYKKYRTGHADGAPPAFVPIHVRQKQASSTAHTELVFPDGRRLNFYHAVDATFLRTLLS